MAEFSNNRKLGNRSTDFVSVKDFGADPTGLTDSRQAFQDAFDSGKPVRIDGDYLLSSGKVSYAADDIIVDARGATITVDGTAGATGFSFGSSATDSLPNHTGLFWEGGTFKNADGTDVIDKTYLVLLGIQDFVIRDVRMEEVSNGGILCRSGCRNGVIENITIPSFSSNSTLRGIWLTGADATDYASVVVDNSTIARNATALPIGGVRDVTIRNCHITGNYNIYLMNSQRTIIENNFLDASDDAARCVTINTYSPYTTVKNNYITSNGNCTGVMATQYSHDTLIEGNKFDGDFGSARAIHIRYLAEAQILNNEIRTEGAVDIIAEMGGNGRVAGNNFNTREGAAKTAGDRCIRIYTIGNAEVAMSGFGNTATVLKGWTFENNVIRTKNFGVQLTQHSDFDTGANDVGIEMVDVKNNTFYNWDDVSNSQEYPLYIGSKVSPSNDMHYNCQGNITIPNASGFEERNRAEDPNGEAIDINGTSQNAAYGSGSWTPTLLDTSGSAGEGQTYSAQVGRWIRNGNIVSFQGKLTMTSLGTLTGGDVMEIGGLPFTINNVANGNWGGVVFNGSGLAITAGNALTTQMTLNTNKVRVYKWDSTTGSTRMTIADVSATGSLSFNGTFEIEDLSV